MWCLVLICIFSCETFSIFTTWNSPNVIAIGRSMELWLKNFQEKWSEAASPKTAYCILYALAIRIHYSMKGFSWKFNFRWIEDFNIISLRNAFLNKNTYCEFLVMLPRKNCHEWCELSRWSEWVEGWNCNVFLHGNREATTRYWTNPRDFFCLVLVSDD